MSESATNDRSRMLNPSSVSCAGKKFYPKAGEAASAAKSRTRAGVAYLRVYHCQSCGGFHLTSEKPRA